MLRWIQNRDAPSQVTLKIERAEPIPAEISTFDFSPDTLSAEDWQRLGLNAKSSIRIARYVEKGGQLYSLDDLAKFGASDLEIIQLKPYWKKVNTKKVSVGRGYPNQFSEKIDRIHGNDIDSFQLAQTHLSPYYLHRWRAYLSTFGDLKSREQILELNLCPSWWMEKYGEYISFVSDREEESAQLNLNELDSNAFYILLGNEHVAHRIIHYRNRLGGFSAREQLLEVKGVDTRSLKLIEEHVDGIGPCQKIDINTVEIEKLAKHPYVGWKRARIIEFIRTKVHPIQNASELYQVEGMDSLMVYKLSPYLDN